MDESTKRQVKFNTISSLTNEILKNRNNEQEKVIANLEKSSSRNTMLWSVSLALIVVSGLINVHKLEQSIEQQEKCVESLLNKKLPLSQIRKHLVQCKQV